MEEINMSEEKQVRTIEVGPYNSQWKEGYLKEMGKIMLIIKNEIIEIHPYRKYIYPRNICKTSNRYFN